jgi:hypothetical protein
MKLDDVLETFSEGLPEYQREINRQWLYDLHALLKPGGKWAYPAKGEIWTKTEEGFELEKTVDS